MKLHVFYLATMFFVGVAYSQEFYEADSYVYSNYNKPPIEPAVRVQTDSRTLSKSESNFNYFPRENRILRTLSSILPRDLFSNPDSFQYMIRKTANLGYGDINRLLGELESCLGEEQLPVSYTPYIRALQSILQVQQDLTDTKTLIQHFQTDRDRSTLPVEFSLPPALSACGLFSPDIFYDPDALVRIIYKLMEIPKNDIPNLIALLRKYRKSECLKFPEKWWDYIDYMSEMSMILKTDILDDLKRDYAEIRRISTTIRGNSD